jgi:ATP-dependent Lon protease
MSEILPIFPLNLVLFPGERLNLHIFEPRYKELIQDSIKNDSLFGIPPFLHGKLQIIGTACKVDEICKTYDDSRMDITVLGMKRFEISETYTIWEPKLYGASSIRWLTDQPECSFGLKAELLSKIVELYALTQVGKKVPSDAADFRLNQFFHYLGLNVNQEYELLIMDTEEEQVQYLLSHLIQMIPAVEASKRMQERVAMNGHFKYLDSPLNF